MAEGGSGRGGLAAQALQALPALQSADYRAFWLAGLASAASLWAMMMGRAWLALEISGSGLSVGVVTFAAMAPWTLAPLGGALADRFDRAHMLMLVRAAALALALGLAALAFADRIALWHLVLFAALSGLVRAFETPAQSALLANTVEAGALLNAVTLSSAAQFGSRLLGPLVGAPLLVAGGSGWLFLVAAGLLVLSIAGLTRVRVRSRGGYRRTHAPFATEVGRNIREGLAYIGRTPPVLMVIALVSLHCMLTMSIDALLPLFARNELNGGAALFGALLMGVGAGALVGTLTLSVLPQGPLRGRLFLAAGVVSGLSIVALALAGSAAAAIVAMVAVGASQASFMALSTTFVQAAIPDAVRGRVMSLYTMAAGGVMAVMVLANGAIADVISVRILLLVPALLFVLLLLAWPIADRELRALLRRGALPAAGEPARPEPVSV